MTAEDRVRALEYLGLTPRQTRFVVTVALHSGFCLRRQYATFAGVEYGKNVRNFLDHLVARGLARRLQFDVNRGYVYHLHARSLYRAIGQEDNRNRRIAAPALIARKLMVLDFVLSETADEWFATEADKVALFRDRFHVPLAHLPRRVYVSTDPRGEPPERYFIDKLPVLLVGDPPLVHFACLVTDSSGQGLARFLWDHRGLLARLPAWAVVAVCPQYVADPRACQSVFDQFLTGTRRPSAFTDASELRWYFATRRAVEDHARTGLSVTVIDRFHRARRRFAGALSESLYADWLVQGDPVIDRLGQPEDRPLAAAGHLVTRVLPWTYRQFGQLPGVA